MLSSILSVTVIATLAMISPGPDFFVVMKNALRYPRNIALMTGLGITIGIVMHMLYCVTGIAALIIAIPTLFNLLKYAGAAYLIWLGGQALLAKANTSFAFNSAVEHHITLKQAFTQGFLCNLLNPKATFFFLALFSQVIDINSTIFDRLIYAIIIVSLSIIWWPLLITLIQWPLIQRNLAAIQHIIDRVLGLLLLLLGLKVAFF